LTVGSLCAYLMTMPGKTMGEAFKFWRNSDGTLSVRCPVCQMLISENLPTFGAVVYKSLLHKCEVRKESEPNPQKTVSPSSDATGQGR